MEAKAKLPRLATLLESVRGRYSGTEWKAGEVVRVTSLFRKRASIEKVPRKPNGIVCAGLPLLNQLAGVPVSVLKFHKE